MTFSDLKGEKIISESVSCKISNIVYFACLQLKAKVLNWRGSPVYIFLHKHFYLERNQHTTNTWVRKCSSKTLHLMGKSNAKITFLSLKTMEASSCVCINTSLFATFLKLQPEKYIYETQELYFYCSVCLINHGLNLAVNKYAGGYSMVPNFFRHKIH
jgi:hypothetical protein